MSQDKKGQMFAKLAAMQHPQPATPEPPPAPAPEVPPPSPAPVEAASTTPSRKPKEPRKPDKAEPTKGKRGNPDYCQANAYVPKSLRRAVDRALLDVEGLDYSSLVTDLLRKWLKSRGVSE